MAIVINMPRLSDTMTEGVVAKWHKKIGDTVNEGDLLAEIETDKATMEFEAFPGQEGKLLYIGTGEGETAPVDTVLAILGDEGEDIEALKAGDAAPAAAPAEEAAPAPAAAPAPEATPAPAPSATPAPAPAPAPAAPAATDGSVKASPLARKLAADRGIDLNMVQGSGDHGRIVKRDVDSFNPAFHTSAQPGAAAAAPAPAAPETPRC